MLPAKNGDVAPGSLASAWCDRNCNASTNGPGVASATPKASATMDGATHALSTAASPNQATIV